MVASLGCERQKPSLLSVRPCPSIAEFVGFGPGGAPIVCRPCDVSTLELWQYGMRHSQHEPRAHDVFSCRCNGYPDVKAYVREFVRLALCYVTTHT